jgi:hypothetical protein
MAVTGGASSAYGAPLASLTTPAAGEGEGPSAFSYGLHPDFFVHRRYDDNEILPWDFIDHSVSKSYLLAEWRKAHLERQTPPCDVTTCHNCKAC